MSKKFYFITIESHNYLINDATDICIVLAKNENKAIEKVKSLMEIFEPDIVESYGEYKGENPSCFKNYKPNYLIYKKNVKHFSDKKYNKLVEKIKEKEETKKEDLYSDYDER